MQIIVNFTTERILPLLQLFLQASQVFVIFYLVNISNASEIDDIDKAHRTMFPYCGSMYQGHTETQARAVNAEDSKRNYRWAAIVWRTNTEPLSGESLTYLCSGSIITDRHIITAGHCICDKENDHPFAFLCRTPFHSKNQILKSNVIEIHAGDQSKSTMLNHEQYQWDATEAYILQGSKMNIKDWNVDIGMAIISKLLPLDKRFFNRFSLREPDELKKAKRVPVCLAAVKYKIAQKTTLGTGWGSDYEQAPTNKPLYSTCMSSEKGPEEWRFQNCEMGGSKVCYKNKAPPDYDMDKCKRYFKKAKLKVAGVDIMYIHKKDKNGLKLTEDTCYQPTHFKKHGWCYLEGAQKITGKPTPWGICSPSCSTKASKTGDFDIYKDGDHQKEWEATVDWNSNNFCEKGNPDWDSKYMLCMKSKLPKTETVTFKWKAKTPNSKHKPIDWKTPFFGTDDNSKSGSGGYRVPCSADSGSGQVVLTSIGSTPLETYKYVLAAVFESTSEDTFVDKGNLDYMPCGSYVKTNTLVNGVMKILKSATQSQSTSWPEIFNWIKQKAEIK